ncbi:MAG: hypothetical protein LBP92_01435 [Deltaproteobacteria bacterium]|nr:hypothetical protein [Deltaproteobacteria bacterium]
MAAMARKGTISQVRQGPEVTPPPLPPEIGPALAGATDAQPFRGPTGEELLACPLPVAIEAVILGQELRNGPRGNRSPEEPGLKILMTRRDLEPFQGQWALPTAILRRETPLGAAASELVERLSGRTGLLVEQLRAFDRAVGGQRLIGLAHLALAGQLGGADAAGPGLAWLDLGLEFGGQEPFRIRLSLPGGQEAGPPAFGHGEAITAAIQRLRGDLDQGGLVARLMPELFTQTHLQRVFELLLGQRLPALAFRRRVAPRLLASGQFVRDKRYRPSRLFGFRTP